MPSPHNWNAPVRRVDAILNAQFVGPDDDMTFEVSFLTETGNATSHAFLLPNDERVGDICIASSATIMDISEETIIAHAVMGPWIAGKGAPVPASTEWIALYQDQGQIPDFQLAMGNARIYAARDVSETLFELDVRKKGTSNPTRTIQIDYGAFLTYRLDPRERIRCLAGGIKLKHPTKVHSVANPLSQADKDAIISTVMSNDRTNGLNRLYM